MRVFSLSRRLVLCGLLAFAVWGCGASETYYPITGKVTLGNTALTSGNVNFVADVAKGNKTKATPGGQIGTDGTYTLSSGDKSGAPAGWYKVTIFTNVPGSPPSSVVLNPKYMNPEATDLAVEVVPNAEPGRYDLKLTP